MSRTRLVKADGTLDEERLADLLPEDGSAILETEFRALIASKMPVRLDQWGDRLPHVDMAMISANIQACAGAGDLVKFFDGKWKVRRP